MPFSHGLTPVLGMKVKRVERYMVIFEDKPINNHINVKISSRARY